MTRVQQAKYEALVRLYKDVSILGVVPRRWPDELYHLEAQEQDTDRLKFVALPTLLSGYGSRYVFVSAKLVSLLATFRPDIVQVEHEPAALVLLELNTVLSLTRQSPSTVLFTWENIGRPKRLLHHILQRGIERLNLHRVSQVIAGNYDAVDIIRSKGYTGPVAMMPQLGVDPEVFSPGPALLERSQLELAGRFVVGFVGRITTRKGVLTLVDALISLENENWILLLVGNGDALDAVRSRLAQVGYESRLRHVPAVRPDELPRYFRCMDVLVVPSETTPTWKEQFGHVLLEAMACEVPIVASSSGHIPWVVADAGLVVAERDPLALASAIRSLIRDSELRRRLIANGRKLIRERYSHEAVARELYRTYESLVRRDHRPPSRMAP